MRVLVCGSREGCDPAAMRVALVDSGATVVIHGGARGVDTIAGDTARALGLTVQSYLAQWQRYGRAAGAIRNQQMLDEGKPALVLAFPGGAGTADMVRRATSSGVPVRQVV